MKRVLAVALFVCAFASPLFAVCPSIVWSQQQQRSGIGHSIDDLLPLDYDSDGKVDLVGVVSANNYWEKKLVLMHGNGNGAFDAPQTIYTGSVGDLHLADANDDGIMDVVGNAGQIAIWLGNGTTGFASPLFVNSFFPRKIHVDDFDGDGDVDLAGVTFDGQYSIYLNGGGMNFTGHASGSLNEYTLEIAVADFDGDDRLDIALTTMTSRAVKVLYRNADGTYAAPVVYAEDLYPSTLLTADFNEDGSPDLVTQRWDDGAAAVYLYAGSRTFTRTGLSISPPTLGANAVKTFVGDVDGDQNLDIIAAAMNTGYFATFSGKGDGTFRSPAYTFTKDGQGQAIGPYAFALGNFDNDNDLDLAVGSYGIVTTFTYACTSSVFLAPVAPVISTGQSGKLEVAVAGISATTALPRGTITLEEGATTHGTAQLDANGRASFTVNNLALGNHTMTAKLTASSELPNATSNTASIDVTSMTTTIALTIGSSTYGTPTSVSVSITSSQGGDPYGYFTLDVDGVKTRRWSGQNPFTLDLLAGAHTISATFEGTSWYPPSSTATYNVTTAKASTSIAHTAGSRTARLGSAHTLTFLLQHEGTPSNGTLQIKQGNTILGSGTMTNDVATITTSALPRGTHDVQVHFAGDANLLAGYANLQLTVLANVSLAIEARAASMAGFVEIYAVLPDDMTSYQLYRRTPGGSFTAVAGWTPTIVIDGGLTPGAQYEYRLDVSRSSVPGIHSSNIDPVQLFTDDYLAAGTFVKRAHFNELLAAVNVYRSAAGLAAFAFDATYDASPIIRASHVDGLRTAANEARSALGMTPFSFTGTITAGATTIQAVQIRELRDAVR